MVELKEAAHQLVDKGSWYVNNDAFSVQHWPLNYSLDEIVSCMAIIWIQAHGVPLGLMTSANAATIANRIGRMIYVEIDTARPLLIGFMLLREFGGKTMICLRYEGLRKFCYRCAIQTEKSTHVNIHYVCW